MTGKFIYYGSYSLPLLQTTILGVFCISVGSFLLHERTFFKTPNTAKFPKTTIQRQFLSLTPWREIEIDYSAANEYVDAHYGEASPSTPYFRRCTGNSSFDHCGRVLEPIYNAREGVYDHDIEEYQMASLPLCGFSLLNSPSNVTDWNEVDQILQYLQDLDACIPSIFPDKQLRHVVFWNPMLRGEGYTNQRTYDDTSVSTSNVATMAHIDTDVGAFESIEELVSMVENNRMTKLSEVADDFNRTDIINSISDGYRFAIINFWRNIDHRPVESSPLAVLYTKYLAKQGSFPQDTPDPIRSLWYTYPSMTKDECLLFLQYDRLQSQPSDLWHCALSPNECNSDPGSGIPRRSFDIRALIVFEEKVPEELDRFRTHRPRPILSLEESGCFCDDQAASRLKLQDDG